MARWYGRRDLPFNVRNVPFALLPYRAGGIAVHIAARVLAAAEFSEVLMSGMVRYLVVGCDIAFDDRGMHNLSGIDGEWHLYALAPTDAGGALSLDDAWRSQAALALRLL